MTESYFMNKKENQKKKSWFKTKMIIKLMLLIQFLAIDFESLNNLELYGGYMNDDTADHVTFITWFPKTVVAPFHVTLNQQLHYSLSPRSCCGSVDKTTDSQSWGPRFKSAGSGSSALGQYTLSSLSSPSERT